MYKALLAHYTKSAIIDTTNHSKNFQIPTSRLFSYFKKIKSMLSVRLPLQYVVIIAANMVQGRGEGWS
jgi:hypothetical protein